MVSQKAVFNFYYYAFTFGKGYLSWTAKGEN